MFKKENKLPVRGKLKTIKVISSPLFSIRVAENTLQIARFSITVPKTVDKRAVYRNKIKRLVAEEVKKLLPDIKKGHDFLLFIKKEILKINSQEIGKELSGRLKINDLL